MRKVIFVTALLLFVGVAFGQSLKKGCILGVHHITITLTDGASMDQFLEALESYLAEAGKHMEGWQGYLVKGNKGENVNDYGLVWYIDSIEAHDKYLNEDDSWTEEMTQVVEKLQPLLDKVQKYGTWNSEFTDWIFL